MPYTTLPMFTISFGETNIDLHSVDLKNMPYSLIISPDFLTEISKHPKPFIRAIAAEHPNTETSILKELLYDDSPIVYYAALENPQTPFEAVLVRWHKLLPDTHLKASPAKIGREEEYQSLIDKYKIHNIDLENIPNKWFLNLLEKS